MNRRLPPAFGLSFAMHVLVATLITWFAPRASSQSSAGPSSSARLSGMPAVTVRPSAPQDVRRRGRDPARARAAEAVEDELVLPREQGPSPLNLPGFQFDFGKIRARGTLLFPFLSLRLPLDPAARRDPGAGTRLISPFARAAEEVPKPPLVLGDVALQNLVDSAWSRRFRWRVFQPVVELAGTYNPDTGRFPVLLRQYIDQNMLQPYLDTTIPDPRLWTELGIAADHADFIEFITEYASEHRSTKATTELLFLLDKLAQGSADALLTLLATNPDRLEFTRTGSREAFSLLVTLRRYYQSLLDLKDLTAPRAIREYYDNIRLTILTGIVTTTPRGYRASDARFLIGGIYWRQGRAPEAVRWWREMTVDQSDGYVAAYSEVLAAISRAGPNGENIDRGRINFALEDERRGWVSFWETRLKQFGYTFDAY